MSKINDLIKKLCPNGVEFKKIIDIAEVGTGSSNRQDAVEDGVYPFYVRSKEVFRINKFEYNEEAIIIPGEGGIGEIFHYVNGKYALHQRAYRIHIVDNRMRTKFLYYYMFNSFKDFIMLKAVNATVTSIRKPMIEQFSVPIPPIEVQEEIIRILDKFGELEEELEEELEARKNQYEFWRRKVFTFENTNVKTIKELCTDVIVPMRDKPKCFDGTIPWCRIEDIEGIYFNTSKSGQFVSEETIKKMNLKVFPTGTVICSCSASIGTYAINTQPLITNQTFIGLVCGKEILNKYLFYFMQTQTKHLLDLSNAGTIPYISRKKFEDLEVPLPSLEEQKRIVNILDRFDKLINDITVGLPAEIELRRKQYEYYRNELLSFEEYGNE